MKLPEIIPYLKDSIKLKGLYESCNLNLNADDILICMKDGLQFNNDVTLFEIEETNGSTEFYSEGVKYVYLLEVSLAAELVNEDFSSLIDEYKIAKRLFEYAINDA